MRILIAEDDPTSRRILEAVLGRWDYEVITTTDGKQALDALTADDAPKLAILDWMMPEMDGPDVISEARKKKTLEPPYIILLTALGQIHDIVAGLESGANDFLTKPFNHEELKARIGVGVRVVQLQEALAVRLRELQEANLHVKTLQGLLPICMHCHKIMEGDDQWLKLETYLSEHTDVQFSHGICPECLEKHYPAEPDEVERAV